MKTITSVVSSLVLCFSAVGQDSKPEPKTTTKPKTESKEVTVVMSTNHGDIHVQLDSQNAPITVKNFLKYVDAKHYDNSIFHRVISNFMIQGGGFKMKDGKMTRSATNGPIKNESQKTPANKRGTIAMARTNVLDSATDQFFINVTDNPNLNHGGPYGGYATFGKVVKGMDVVDKIKAVETTFLGREKAKPVKTVTIKSIRRLKVEATKTTTKKPTSNSIPPSPPVPIPIPEKK